MRIVVHHDAEEYVAQWLADAIQAQFPALVTEVEVVRDLPPPPPATDLLSDLLGPVDISGIVGPINDMMAQITTSFSGLSNVLSGIDLDALGRATEAIEKVGAVIESADGHPEAVEASPRPAEVHARISGDLVPHSEVFASTVEGRKYLASATFNPVLSHANC